MDEKNRQTGRTSRMLAEAIKHARHGRAVYVLAADEKHISVLQDMAGNEAHELGVKIETSESLGNFDWQEMKLLNAHPNCIVLVDHYAIEKKYAAMLEMLHRFD